MITKTTYVCEYCGAGYIEKEDALQCERHHIKPVGFGDLSYNKAMCVSDNQSKFPTYIHVKFEGGAMLRYERS